MKKSNGLKISALLSLVTHLLSFFLLTLLFPNSNLKSSHPIHPLEIFLSKFSNESPPKRVSFLKPLEGKNLQITPQPLENLNYPVASESEPPQILNKIEEETEVLPLKESLNQMTENIPSVENDLSLENKSGEENRLAVENHPVGENHIEMGHRSVKPEGEKESEILLEAFKGNSPSIKEVLLIYPRSVENPKPIYPREARKKGYEGEVLLRVEVLTSGRVGQIEVRRSSGYEILDRSAIETIKQWRFIPAQKGEDRVTFWVNIPIKFQLQ